MTVRYPHPLTRRAVLKGSAVLPVVAGAANASAAQNPVAQSLAQTAPNSELIAGNTAFALDLYARIRQQTGENLLISPYSISEALAMTYLGARGETATQMANALSFELPRPELHEAFHSLDADLVARGNAEDNPESYESGRALRIANALWGEQTYPISEAYNAQLAQYYGAELHGADFINAPEEAREEINDWVTDQTEDHIENIVPEGAITPDTVIVLANAIWFFGQWNVPFWPEATSDDAFFLLDGTTVTVPFMFKASHLGYARGNGLQVIEFPYAESEFALTVILPDEGQFESVESAFDPEKLNTAINQLSRSDMLVYLPRFEFEFDAELSSTLQAMGMQDAFDPSRADFTGMVEGTPPAPLFLGDVLHKARISVDENGTEAAASTVVTMVGSAAPQEPTEVRINRPFLFAIRDTQAGTLLFLGRVMNPGE